MLKHILILLILVLSQTGCAIHAEVQRSRPIVHTPEDIQFYERLKRELLQLEDIKVGEGPIAAAGRKLTAHITVRYRDGALAYEGPAVSYWGLEDDVFIHNSPREPHMLSLSQEGIVLGLNGMAVGGKRRIVVPANMVCYNGRSVGDSLDKGENPGRYCGLTLPYESKGGAATFKKALIVEATLTDSCRPVFPRVLGFYIGERCRDSDAPKREASDPIWRFYYAAPPKPWKEKGTGYFSSGFLGLPRCRIVDSNPNVSAIFACHSSLPNGCCRFTQVRNVTSS
jgi:hypothetical protein